MSLSPSRVLRPERVQWHVRGAIVEANGEAARVARVGGRLAVAAVAVALVVRVADRERLRLVCAHCVPHVRERDRETAAWETGEQKHSTRIPLILKLIAVTQSSAARSHQRSVINDIGLLKRSPVAVDLNRAIELRRRLLFLDVYVKELVGCSCSRSQLSYSHSYIDSLRFRADR